MSPQVIFAVQSILGYLAWLLCFRAYILPWLKSMDQAAAQRAIATVHSFRFFGLAALLPGVVSPNLPSGFATVAAYWDLATGVLAILTLLTIRVRPLFWSFVIAFNLVGLLGLILTYFYAVQIRLPWVAGQLGAAYVIPILYVPLQMVTHLAAFYLLLRRQSKPAQAFAGDAAGA